MIDLYTKDNCSTCKEIKEILKSKNIDFKEFNLSDPGTIEDVLFKTRSTGVMTLGNAPIMQKDGLFYFGVDAVKILTGVPLRSCGTCGLGGGDIAR